MAYKSKYPPVETFDEAVERFVQAAVDQGFGRTVTDPVVIAKLRVLCNAPVLPGEK